MRYWYITPEDYERAAANGINAKALVMRVRGCGWDIDRACTEPLQRQTIKKLVTDEIRQKLIENGISNHEFGRRIRSGWSVEEAAGTPILKGKARAERAMRDKRVISDEEYKIAEANGIKKTTLQARIFMYHWSREKALTTPPLSNIDKRNILRQTCGW